MARNKTPLLYLESIELPRLCDELLTVKETSEEYKLQANYCLDQIMDNLEFEEDRSDMAFNSGKK